MTMNLPLRHISIRVPWHDTGWDGHVYSIADAVAAQLVPGLRERMRRPRFLTATAVSWAVTRGFDEERVAIVCLDALERRKDAAFRGLENAIAQGFSNVRHLRRDTDLRSLHRDKRWKAILKKLPQLARP